MAIFIGDKYKVEADRYNIILYTKQRNEKQGFDYWIAECYFSNFESLLKSMIMMDVRDTGLNDLKTVIDTIKTAEQNIKQILLSLPTEVLDKSLWQDDTSDNPNDK